MYISTILAFWRVYAITAPSSAHCDQWQLSRLVIVKRIMGAYVPEREEDRKLKTSGKYTDLGDGYILPGYVISVVKRMPGEEEA